MPSMATKKKPSPKTAKSAPAPNLTIKVTRPAKKRLPTAPAVGLLAPSFVMPATMVGKITHSSLKGKPYVLYFYPKDNTSGCTAEACDFQDTMPAFKKLGVTVIGVSKDSIENHEKFARKYKLTFPLASDEKTNISEAYGVWVKKSMYGRQYLGIERSTFLIDSKGVIRSVWRKVSVSGHVLDVMKAIEEL